LVLAALRRRPGDHRLLVTLGYLAMISAPGAPLEYEKWFRAAVAVRPRSPVAHNYLGLALLNNKQPREAVAEFREATRLEPRYAGAHNNLGVALDNLGDKDGAIDAFRQAADSAPDYMLAHANLATLLEERGDLDEAVRRYDQWIQLDPKGPLALRRLAWILATAPDARLRNAPRALALATRACALTAKKDPECLDALAAALAEAGDFDEAVAAEKRALSFPAFERDSGAAARHRLSLYGRKLAYHTAHVAPPPHEVKPR
jgi:Flp pilus assembly protein TadD